MAQARVDREGTPVRERTSPPSGDAEPLRSPTAPVLIFAAVAVASLAIGGQAIVRWVLSSQFKPTETGPDPYEGWRLASLRIFEVASVFAVVVVVIRFVVLPLVRNRRLGFDGMLVIGCATAAWMDPLMNYFHVQFLYNRHFLNRGSWAPFIPGWNSPNGGRLADGFIYPIGSYIWWPIIGVILGSMFLKKISAARPRYSAGRLIAILFAIMLVFDAAFEAVLIRIFHFYAIPYGPSSLSLSSGEWYQIPIYIPFGVTAWMVALTALRHFRNSDGDSFAEAGVRTLRCSPRTKSMLRFLGIVGFVHASLFIGYYAVVTPFSLKTDRTPSVPSYFRAEICGPATSYACPGRRVPIPSRTSVHVGPDDPRIGPR